MLSPRTHVRQVSLNGEEQIVTYRGLFPLCFWWLVGWDPQWTPDRPPWPARCSWLEAPVRCSCMQRCTLLLPARIVVNPENWKHEKIRIVIIWKSWFWISEVRKCTKVHEVWRFTRTFDEPPLKYFVHIFFFHLRIPLINNGNKCVMYNVTQCKLCS